MTGIPGSKGSRLAGFSVVGALGNDLAVFEKRLRQGVCGIRDHLAGWPVALMDPAAFQREGGEGVTGLVKDVAEAAFRHAGEDPTLLADPDTILVISSAKGDIEGLASPTGETSLGPFAGRVTRALGHTGHHELVSCACASGGIALARASRLLEGGWGQRALVIGVEVLNRFLVAGFASLGALSSRAARPFDVERDGLTLGEGVAAVLLDRAEGAGVRLTGVGQSCDASGLVRPCEDGSGLGLAVERALEGAGPGAVHAICGHGTGTVANDDMEAAAFRTLFGEAVPPVFGLKGATGHTMGCCGITEAVACAVAALGGFIPGTVGYRSGDQGLDVVDRTQPAKPGRLLSVNSGFGGINVALVLDHVN